MVLHSIWRRKMEGSNERFKRICVFCGSSSGNKTVFSDAALDLGRTKNRPRVWWGERRTYGFDFSDGLQRRLPCSWIEQCDIDIFDVIAMVCENFRRVIPTALMPLEISGQTVGEVKTVTDMHERKAEMARQADAFIALPGGYGTMEELLEMITWSQLGIHDKPVGLLNVDGYYNCLLALFDKGVEEGFIKPAARHIVVSAPTAKELILRMEEYVPMHDQVAPRKCWEIEQLRYSAAPNDH